jgi:hypothetical protein
MQVNYRSLRGGISIVSVDDLVLFKVLQSVERVAINSAGCDICPIHLLKKSVGTGLGMPDTSHHVIHAVVAVELVYERLATACRSYR